MFFFLQLLWNQYSLLFIHMNTVKDVDVLVCFLLYCNAFVNQGPQSYCKEGCCVQLLPPSVRGSHRSWCWWSQSVCWVFIEHWNVKWGFVSFEMSNSDISISVHDTYFMDWCYFVENGHTCLNLRCNLVNFVCSVNGLTDSSNTGRQQQLTPPAVFCIILKGFGQLL